MRTTYRVLAYLLALSVAVQASLIAFGAFALENNIDNGPVSDGDTTGMTLHHSFAYVVLLFAAALAAVSSAPRSSAACAGRRSRSSL